MDADWQIRVAEASDGALMQAFMKKLGRFQKMEMHVTATAEQLSRRIARGEAKAVFGLLGGRPVAFMFYYQVASAFIGEAGFYIDALYVDETARGRGCGRALMRFLAAEAVAADYGRIEWGCLDWNEAALSFYEDFAAKPVGEMTIHRMHRTEIQALLNEQVED